MKVRVCFMLRDGTVEWSRGGTANLDFSVLYIPVCDCFPGLMAIVLFLFRGFEVSLVKMCISNEDQKSVGTFSRYYYGFQS